MIEEDLDKFYEERVSRRKDFEDRISHFKSELSDLLKKYELDLEINSEGQGEVWVEAYDQKDDVGTEVSITILDGLSGEIVSL